MQENHLPHILNRTPCNPLQLQLPIRLPPLLPRIQPFVRLDAERIIPLSNDLVNFARAQIFLLDRGDGGRCGSGGGRVAGRGVTAAVGVVGFVFVLFGEEEEGVEVGGHVYEGVY